MTVATRLARLEKLLPAPAPPSPFTKYQRDPLGYIHEVLGQRLWSAQEEIVRLGMQHPYKVAVKSCHKVGKSFLMACLICWHFDCFAQSLTITTAPTDIAVKDQLWREVRILRAKARLGGFPGEAAAELWGSHDHWAKGRTAKSGEALQGQHQTNMLFIIDEAVGVAPWVFDVFRSMFKFTGLHHWFIIGNPTDTSSQMYAEGLNVNSDGEPAWRWVTMSALDHPNLAAELRGEPPPFPAAVDLAQFDGWVADWCDPVPADEADPVTDFEWRPGSGNWFRPGPEMEARGLGRWPSAGTFGVWSDALWQHALRPLDYDLRLDLPQIGCDVARFGDDYTTIHVRVGPVSVHHERHNGWPTDRTAGRLKELCREWTERTNAARDAKAAPVRPQQIRVNVDDGGVGGGVTDQRGDYLFVPVIAQSNAANEDRYPDKRSELWFATAGRARRGRLSVARLAGREQRRLQQQAMAPTWKQDAQGRRAVEPKDKMKERLGIGSPDDMDGMNLAYYEAPISQIVAVEPDPAPQPHRSEYERMREREQRGHWSERR